MWLRKCSNVYYKTNIFKGLTKSTLSSLSNVNVLGIETSCDDTGCAVVNSEATILGEFLHSQNETHVKYGGVIPINARELHRDNIELAVDSALNNARIGMNDIDAIAVTAKPGLLLSLMIGVKYANFLAKKFKKPIIPVHHMEAHALVVRIYYNIPFPYLALLISGGHCLLTVVKDVDNFLLLGQTLDNAPGEVMDKAARRMKLKNIPEYSLISGGRAIELAAKNATNPSLFEFPVPLQKNRDCNFSFSGLKDSLVRKVIKKESEHGLMGDEIIPEIYDLCASFQTGITKHLAHRLERAVKFCELKNLLDNNAKNIVVSGGVACNDYIFSNLKSVVNHLGYNIYRPPHRVCTDNGIMIAWNGIEKTRKGIETCQFISPNDVHPISPLGVNIIDQVKEANVAVKSPRFREVN
ncbi:PREDICTED: probable tRNA N6-adenosine threonylcarbamoyltransferase, mitochondrial [Papilio polytes]|uniref:probable tRNA N6-adenosine threonylcarbamoyltransferase, mitochondrial n=1 Tax=Papilio polytes TaxID=76194 RepID=UPI00067639A2|nr:PREDICTED: probable tRNA N6-adenosine threonylcarbamoyltransferase, mitochondrial [Papilio polytes]